MLPDLKTVKIGMPAQRALEAAGIKTLIQICEYSKQDLLALHGVGPKAVHLLNEILIREGLSLKG